MSGYCASELTAGHFSRPDPSHLNRDLTRHITKVKFWTRPDPKNSYMRTSSIKAVITGVNFENLDPTGLAKLHRNDPTKLAGRPDPPLDLLCMPVCNMGAKSFQKSARLGFRINNSA